MKPRNQLTQALDRAYKQSDALRLNIGLGDNSEESYDALDAILDRIDRLIESIAEHDTRQAQWRRYHVPRLLAYCQAKRTEGRTSCVA